MKSGAERRLGSDFRDTAEAATREFVRAQRLSCLIKGEWFPQYNPKGKVPNTLRFYKVSRRAVSGAAGAVCRTKTLSHEPPEGCAARA